MKKLEIRHSDILFIPGTYGLCSSVCHYSEDLYEDILAPTPKSYFGDTVAGYFISDKIEANILYYYEIYS